MVLLALQTVRKRFLCFSPEVVQSQPYGEKADVWASGCILYQMATLEPPFFSSNMLALATKVQLWGGGRGWVGEVVFASTVCAEAPKVQFFLNDCSLKWLKRVLFPWMTFWFYQLRTNAADLLPLFLFVQTRQLSFCKATKTVTLHLLG